MITKDVKRNVKERIKELKFYILALEYLIKHLEKNNEQEFDYPDYCGLPKKIANKLMGDDVDEIQEIFSDCFVNDEDMG